MKQNAIQFLSSVAIPASYVFIPPLARESGASDIQLGMIGVIYGLTAFTSSYLFGRASDVYGRKFFLQ